MSTFTGRQHPGAARAHREAKQVEAKVRQTRHELRIREYEIAHNVPEDVARILLQMPLEGEHRPITEWTGDGRNTPYLVCEGDGQQWPCDHERATS
jgi:hypothetical protein